TRAWPWPDGEVRFPGIFRMDADLFVSHAEGAYRLRLAADTLVSMEAVGGERFAYPVHGVVRAPWGQVLGTDEGVFMERRTAETPTGEQRILLETGPTRALSNTVLAVADAGKGRVWMGTRNGLYRMQVEPEARVFESLLEGIPVLSVAADGRSGRVAESAVSPIWVGTFGEGVFAYTDHARRVDMGSCNPTVWSLAVSASGSVWAGTDRGLCVLAPGSTAFRQVALGRAGAVSANDQGHDAVAVNTVVEHGRDSVWAGTNEGLCQVGGTCNTALGPVQGLASDGLGRLWVATTDGRVRVDGRVVAGRSDAGPEDTLRIGGEGGWHVLPLDDRVFISSATGLYALSDRGGYRLLEGIVYGAAVADDDHLWATTSRGLMRSALTDEGPPDFVRVGAFQEEFNRRALLSHGAALFAGGMEGLTLLYPRAMQPGEEAAPDHLVVTGLDVAGRDSSWSWAGVPRGGVTLSHLHVSMAVQLAAPRIAPEYRYRLEGFDDAWSETTARTARYTNLPPGRYTFRAEARAVGSTASVSFPVVVRQAWYATWWFRVLLVLSLCAALTVVWRLRRAHEAALERVRARIASDLHDDVGSRLAGIALLSELVGAAPTLGEKEARRLKAIEQSARELVTSVRDITWLIHPSSDGLDDLADRMRETAHQLLGDREWTLHSPVRDAHIPIDMTTRRHVFLVFREALHNIGRHAAPEASVGIRLEERAGRLVLDIRDTGCGFDTQAAPGGHGLRSMQERAHAAGGKLTMDSEPGRGTHICLEVPLSS
ncbi:MAG: hypothetical protein COV99_09105, partial [Bacteroidetes bacterium CG12_big_fil_rev_8_21_14_0_65_60_17]